MHMKEITPSGSVGKQVFSATGEQRWVKGVTLTPATASAATVILRDGESSGEVVFTGNRPAGDGGSFKVCHKFTKGLHVKVTPANALAYLIIE